MWVGWYFCSVSFLHCVVSWLMFCIPSSLCCGLVSIHVLCPFYTVFLVGWSFLFCVPSTPCFVVSWPLCSVSLLHCDVSKTVFCSMSLLYCCVGWLVFLFSVLSTLCCGLVSICVLCPFYSVLWVGLCFVLCVLSTLCCWSVFVLCVPSTL